MPPTAAVSANTRPGQVTESMAASGVAIADSVHVTNFLQDGAASSPSAAASAKNDQLLRSARRTAAKEPSKMDKLIRDAREKRGGGGR